MHAESHSSDGSNDVVAAGDPVRTVRIDPEADLVTLTRQIVDVPSVSGSEDALAGGKSAAEAAMLVTEGAEPPSDHSGSSEYRAHLAQVMARRALEQALGD